MTFIDLADVPVVDNHCHGIYRGQDSLDLVVWRGCFAESADSELARDHAGSTVYYHRLLRDLAEFLGCEPEEGAALAARRERDWQELVSALLRAANLEALLVDGGYPQADQVLPDAELGRLAGCRTAPILRLETLMERLISEHSSLPAVIEALVAELTECESGATSR